MEDAKKITTSVSGSYVGVQKQIALFAYFLLCVRGYIGALEIETVYITLLLNFLIFISIDYRHLKKSILLLPFFILIIFYNREALAIVDILTLVYVLKDVSVNKLILINAIVLAFFICYWQYALALGILKSEIWVMPKGIAQTLGFANPNTLGFLGFQVVSSVYLLFRKHSKVLVLLVILAINECFFSFSFSRTSWLGGLIFSFVLLLMVFKLLRPWMKCVIGIIPILIATLIIYFAKNIASYPELDVIFTTRFSCYSVMLSQMSLVNWIIGIRRPMDMPMDGSYTCLLFDAGIVGLILFLCTFCKSLLKNFASLREYMPFLIGMLACGVGENTFSSISGISLIFWFLFMNSDNLCTKSVA